MRRYMPVFMLVILSPLVAEVLFGATTITRIFGLLPLTALYGGAAVVIRELARRRGTGWGRIALLGAAYAIFEEGLAVQSMFNPDLFGAGALGARALGVNWVWTEWTIGYHIVLSILIPILLTEMLFPSRRNEPWLGPVGIAVAGLFCGAGALAIGAVFRFVITPNFRTPAYLTAAAAVVIVILVSVALGFGRKAPAAPPVPFAREPARDAPSPWLVGLAAFLAAALWFGLLGLPEQMRGDLVLLPMLFELAVAATLVLFVRRWSAPDRRWTDLHRLALAFGAMLVTMLVGFFAVTAGNPVDQLGQGIAGLLAVALMALFARRLRRRTRTSDKLRAPLAEDVASVAHTSSPPASS